MYDRNPNFGKDLSFTEGARRVADLLWETSGGDLSSFPKSYLEELRHEFSDGKVSMLELIDRVDLGENATYDDYCEVVDALLKVDPSEWPNPEHVVDVPKDLLLYELESDYNFSEFDFEEEIAEEEMPQEGAPGGDPMSDKIELFLKKVISSVYMDGVSSVTDLEGNPPTLSNNYLLSEDGKQFSGIFYDAAPGEDTRKFPFAISETAEGKWSIKY